jgi:hypothetical protein
MAKYHSHLILVKMPQMAESRICTPHTGSLGNSGSYAAYRLCRAIHMPSPGLPKVIAARSRERPQQPAPAPADGAVPSCRVPRQRRRAVANKFLSVIASGLSFHLPCSSRRRSNYYCNCTEDNKAEAEQEPCVTPKVQANLADIISLRLGHANANETEADHEDG